MYIGLHVKCVLFLFHCNQNCSAEKFSRKSVHLESSCYMWTDGRTDGYHEAYSRFTKATKKSVNLRKGSHTQKLVLRL